MNKTVVRALMVAPLLALALAGTTAARADYPVAVDVAQSAGIAATTSDMYGNVVVFDYNNDGSPDLFLSQHVTAPAQVYRGNGDGTFTLAQAFPAGVDRHGCTAGDFNADGRPDLFCAVGAQHGTTTTKSNELWLQDDSGTFILQDRALGADDGSGRGRDSQAVDVNNDGIDDVFVGNAFPNLYPSPNRLFISDGTRFTEDTNLRPKMYSGGVCIATADFNSDGFQDIYVCGAPDHLLINDGVGGFDDRAKTIMGITPPKSLGAQWGDVNGDGVNDLVTVQSTTMKIFLGGSGRLTLAYTRTLAAGRAVALADVDGDGLQDIYVVQGRISNTGPNQPDYLMMNGGALQFTDYANLPTVTTGGGSAVGVIPNYANGHPAFVVTNGGDGSKTFKGPRQLIAFQ